MIFCLISVVFFLISFILYLLGEGDGDFGTGLICGALIVILMILIGMLIPKKSKPQAIDVYRGKTELEIHSINNMPQDTVVVWKNN